MYPLRVVYLAGLAGTLLGYRVGLPGADGTAPRQRNVATADASAACARPDPQTRPVSGTVKAITARVPVVGRPEAATGPIRHSDAGGYPPAAWPARGDVLAEEAGGIDADTAEAMRLSDEAAQQDGLEFSSRDATLDEAQHATRGITGRAGP